MCYGILISGGDECDSQCFACAIPIDCLRSTFLSQLLRVRAIPNSVVFIVGFFSVRHLRKVVTEGLRLSNNALLIEILIYLLYAFLIITDGTGQKRKRRVRQ